MVAPNGRRITGAATLEIIPKMQIHAPRGSVRVDALVRNEYIQIYKIETMKAIPQE